MDNVAVFNNGGSSSSSTNAGEGAADSNNSVPPAYTHGTGTPGNPDSFRESDSTAVVNFHPRTETITDTVDSDDEDDQENIVANDIAIITPRQVMRMEFYRAGLQARGRSQTTEAGIARRGSGATSLFEGTAEELEKGETWFRIAKESSPPLFFEFLGSFILGLVIHLMRLGPNVAETFYVDSAAVAFDPENRTADGKTAFFIYFFTVSALMYSLGHVSGGHFNPAVTLAVFCRRHLTFPQLLLYGFAQFGGFMLSSVASLELLDAVRTPVHLYPLSEWEQTTVFVVTAIFAFAFIFTILCTSTTVAQSGNSHFGVAAGAMYGVAMITLKSTGATLNPAFDAATTLVNYLWNGTTSLEEAFKIEELWGIYAGPFAGALVAALMFRYIKVTAFTKRTKGACNKLNKALAPFWVEAIGSFMITFIFCFFNQDSSDQAIQAIDALKRASDIQTFPVAYMGIVIGMVYSGGFISGGHYNPIISLAVYVQGKMAFLSFFFYVIVQLAGAFGAGTTYWFLFSETPVPSELSSLQVSKKVSGSLEAIFCFLLVTVVLNSGYAKSNRGNSFYGLAYGFTLFIATTLIGPLSGGIMNPAIAIGTLIARASWNSKTDLMGGVFAGDFEAAEAQLTGVWLSVGVPFAASLLAAYSYKASVGTGLDLSFFAKIGKALNCCHPSSRLCKKRPVARHNSTGATEMIRLSDAGVSGDLRGLNDNNDGGSESSSPLRVPRSSV
jgi:aquaporin Z